MSKIIYFYLVLNEYWLKRIKDFFFRVTFPSSYLTCKYVYLTMRMYLSFYHDHIHDHEA